MKRRSWPILTACAAALTAALPAALPLRAATGVWTPLGPLGGGVVVSASSADPQRLWAAGQGVFLSSDGGQRWERRSLGLPAATPAAAGAGASLALDPHDGDTAYAWSLVSGLFKTFDAGRHWSPLVFNLDPGGLFTVAVDPASSLTLYVGAWGGAFKSVDGGSSWTAINTGLPPGAAIMSLGVDPLDPGTVYAGFTAQTPTSALCGWAKTVDSGAHWHASASNGCYTQWVFDPRSPGLVYAYDGAALWLTSDGGQSWRRGGRRLGNSCGFALDRSQPQLIYAACAEGFFRSTNGGLGFFRFGSLAATPLRSVTSTSDGRTLWASTSGSCLEACGPLRSTDGGASWTASAAGLVAVAATAVLVDSSNPSHILIGIYGYGVASSSDGGITWQGSTGFASVQPGISVDSLDQSAGPAPVFVARTSYQTHSGAVLTLYRSIDGGLTWSSFGPASVAFAFHPINPQRAVTSLPAISYSDDGGATWKPAGGEVANGTVSDFRFSPARPDDAYAVGLVRLTQDSSQNAIWKSTDGGVSWHRIAQPLADAGAVLIFPDPTSPELAYASGGRTNLWSSADGGLTWTPMAGAAGFAIGSLALAPTHPTTLVGLSSTLGIVLSTDGGAHWTAANVGLPTWSFGSQGPFAFVTRPAITADPRDPQHLYAAVNGGGLEELTLPVAAGCTPSATALCFNAGRFKVEVAWRDFQGNSGTGQAVPFTSDSGYFWFFDAANVELVIKVLDKRDLNNAFWVFYGSMSTVEYHITITDTATGRVRTYSNPSGHLGSLADTNAFPGP